MPKTSPALPQAPNDVGPVHPRGVKARVLLTSVFGPYGQDDEYGSRAINPMELYHNQVTRTQGPFSLRMFHRSWGLMLIQANISAPCTLLDFPTRERFIEELRTGAYDIIGISSIMPNIGKVEHMCELIREHQPRATIVIGGHVANIDQLQRRTQADFVVKGEGVTWFRHFLGERTDRPVKHPRIFSGLGTRALGMALKQKPRDAAATLIPSVGCPVGCNFCATSAMFGGKGHSHDFFKTGEELFEVMCGLERDMKLFSFFVMDENFLLHRQRALKLLELMEKHNKAWALYVFTSAKVLQSYTIDQLVRLGISWVWMGLEGKDSKYAKLSRINTFELVRSLQANGIRVLGSSIIGMEEHTPENIDAAIDHAVAHDTEFHQFMLYTPLPGTPLWEEHAAAGTLTDTECRDMADTHGQLRFNFRHPHITDGREGEYLLRAFDRDFEVNGPSLARLIRTSLAGFRRHRHHPDQRVRKRFRMEAAGLATTHAAAIWACRAWYRHDPRVRARLDALLHDLYGTFGWRARLSSKLMGRIILSRIRREDRRLRHGWTYEPPTFYEKANEPGHPAGSLLSQLAKGRWVRPAAAPLPQPAV